MTLFRVGNGCVLANLTALRPTKYIPVKNLRTTANLFAQRRSNDRPTSSQTPHMQIVMKLMHRRYTCDQEEWGRGDVSVCVCGGGGGSGWS